VKNIDIKTSARMATGPAEIPISKSVGSTELIKIGADKFKYINTGYEKVSAKMYDFKCDVRFKVEKETFRAHKYVLSEASDYFSAMFSHNMKEKEQDVIEMHEISPKGFTCMLEYFYHGHVTIEPLNIEDILEAARFFHIEFLLSSCCDFLVRHLSLENYSSVLHLSDTYALGDLRYEIFKFVGVNFQQLKQQPSFLSMQFELLYTLLAEDYFVDAPETLLFETILQWVKHDKETREEHLIPLLEQVRFPLMDLDDLENIPQEIVDLPSIDELIEEAQDYQTNPGSQCLMTSPHTETRGSRDLVMLISAIDDADLFQYKVPGDHGFYTEETSTSFMHSVFEFSAVTVLGNFLFVAGGYDRYSWCSSPAFYRYNPRNRLWVQLASMRQPRVSFSLCAGDSGIFAVGGIEHVVEAGHDRELILSTAEFFDPCTGTWKLIAGLPVGCFSIAAAVIKENLYISGGINDDPEDTVPVNHLRMYIVDENTWRPRNSMIYDRQGHSMVGFGNKLYVFGGYTSGADTMSFGHCLQAEVYDEETNQWSELQPSPSSYGHIYPAATVLDGKIFIMGGQQSSRVLGCFDPETGVLDEGEYCGHHVQRMVTIKVAIPSDIE